MKKVCRLWVSFLGACTLISSASGDERTPVEPARGPLRVHPENPRYFTDGSRDANGDFKAVLLTGSHTWNNLVDMGRSDPPEAFDYAKYLDSLKRYGHNFIRLWAWDSTVWDTRANPPLGKDFVHHAAPQPWLRTGPGEALDGKPKFDLSKFNPEYFERLRSRVQQAGDRGIYVGIMLFEGWGLMHGNRRRNAEDGWAWRNHPFNPANNTQQLEIKGADAFQGRVHTLDNPEVNQFQKAYIHKVIDTVNDLDNVLYEVINEGGEKEWNWWVIDTIHEYEQDKPKQHPAGNTGHGAEDVESMLASPAEWISPGRRDGYAENPPAWNEKKVSLLDTDHIWGVGGNADWVWKSFLRGHNPIFMDPYDGSVLGADEGWEPLRNALGMVRLIAETRVDLAGLRPRNKLSSTGFCLANPGMEYVVYQPLAAAPFTVDLKPGRYRVETYYDRGGLFERGEIQASGGMHQFQGLPDSGAVLLLRNTNRN
jgi:hypothetical protein